jgi:CBS domain-containing protein
VTELERGELAEFLGRHRPFSHLGAADLAELASAATVADHGDGQLVLDAFTDPTTEVFVVIEGRVDVWNDPARLAEPPDEVLDPGGLFGFSAMLTERSVGPRVRATGHARVARIPGALATPVFTSRQGARFLAQSLAARGRGGAPSSTAADVALHARLNRAETVEDLERLARGIPSVLGELLAGGLASGRVIALYSSIIDTAVRRAIRLVLAAHPELDHDAFTWLSLGSNGRQEAVLSSDIDSAVAFLDDVPVELTVAYRAAFGEVHDVLARGGLSRDWNGATASREPFARTNSEWRAAALRWMASPELNQGAIMASLLVDGRPIEGDPALPAAMQVFSELRRHEGTMRLLLEESLAHRARLRTSRDALRRRPAEVDVKDHALLPLVNLARWAALSAGSQALGTRDRLRAAAGSTMLPEDRAADLVDVFDTLQRLRLRYQLMQHEAGQPPSDTFSEELMSPMDRSVVAQAVREIASVQKRMTRLSVYLPADQWSLPTP